MSHRLPASFVARMCGGARPADPSRIEIAAIDTVLRAEGVLLSRVSLRDHWARVTEQETTGSQAWFVGHER